MKKIIPLIAVAFIAAVVLLSVVPDYRKSQQPLNKLATFAKSNGFGMGVMVKDSDGQQAAEQEIAKVEQILKRGVPTRFYVGDAAMILAAEVGGTIPGYLLIDADGNLSVVERGRVTAQKLTSHISELHIH